MAKSGTYEVEGTFHHIFYSTLNKKTYDTLVKKGEIESDELITLTEDSDDYNTFFGGDLSDIQLTVDGGKVYNAEDLRIMSVNNTKLAEDAGAIVNFCKSESKYFIIGLCVYKGSDFCEFKGKFDPSKLQSYMGRLSFEGNEEINIGFFQFFYEGGTIQEGSEEEYRTIYLWSGSSGLTELALV